MSDLKIKAFFFSVSGSDFVFYNLQFTAQEWVEWWENYRAGTELSEFIWPRVEEGGKVAGGPTSLALHWNEILKKKRGEEKGSKRKITLVGVID